MILFLNEDRAYLNWVTHHRNGFVLDCHRQPAKHRATLHRATCPDVKLSATKRTHWTTGPHMKACSLDAEELKSWAVEQTGAEADVSESCLAPPETYDENHPLHLTKLDREILAFVLEVALLHLDGEVGAYWLNVATVAKCLDKTPAQLRAALGRLVDDGLITIGEPFKADVSHSTKQILAPTVAAMKNLPSYQKLSEEEIKADIKQLLGETEE